MTLHSFYPREAEIFRNEVETISRLNEWQIEELERRLGLRVIRTQEGSAYFPGLDGLNHYLFLANRTKFHDYCKLSDEVTERLPINADYEAHTTGINNAYADKLLSWEEIVLLELISPDIELINIVVTDSNGERFALDISLVNQERYLATFI